LSCIQALRGALDAAITECQRRAELAVDLPDAYFYTGRCYLFRGNLYAALDAYCKASLKCEAVEQIGAERKAVEAMAYELNGDKRDLQSLSSRQSHMFITERHL
jgi:hypothetical protein